MRKLALKSNLKLSAVGGGGGAVVVMVIVVVVLLLSMKVVMVAMVLKMVVVVITVVGFKLYTTKMVILKDTYLLSQLTENLHPNNFVRFLRRQTLMGSIWACSQRHSENQGGFEFALLLVQDQYERLQMLTPSGLEVIQK